jgi:hypothetical protein
LAEGRSGYWAHSGSAEPRRLEFKDIQKFEGCNEICKKGFSGKTQPRKNAPTGKNYIVFYNSRFPRCFKLIIYEDFSWFHKNIALLKSFEVTTKLNTSISREVARTPKKSNVNIPFCGVNAEESHRRPDPDPNANLELSS